MYENTGCRKYEEECGTLMAESICYVYMHNVWHQLTGSSQVGLALSSIPELHRLRLHGHHMMPLWHLRNGLRIEKRHK